MKHRQEYNMRLNRLIKKYTKLCKKASKLHEQILDLYKAKYLDNDKKTCKQILNTMYGQQQNFGSVLKKIYKDTDSIADGMKYTE